MSAQIVIFIDDNNLMAFDISSGQTEVIGFDGRKKLPCTGAVTAEKFSSYINDYFNFEDISELAGKVLLIDCGAAPDAGNAIMNILKKSSAQLKAMTQDSVAAVAFRALKNDDEMRIKEYGMNFCGKHYFLSDGKLRKKEFLLTGYCLNIEESIKYIKDEI